MKTKFLQLHNSVLLTRKQLKTIDGSGRELAFVGENGGGTGGSGDRYECTCHNHAGTWQGTYGSQAAAIASVGRYCDQGMGACYKI